MDTETVKVFFYIVSYILVLGGVPVFLARNKQRGVLLPFLLGVFLGPIGWIIAAFMRPPLTPEQREKMREEVLKKRSNPSDWM